MINVKIMLDTFLSVSSLIDISEATFDYFPWIGECGTSISRSYAGASPFKALYVSNGILK